MTKKKTLLIIIVLIVIAIIIASIVLVVNKTPEDTNKDNNISNVQNQNTGKLQSYISKLGDDYYIKYSGKFKDNNKKYVDAIIEYTKSGEDYGFRSTEINMYLLYKDKKMYSISHRYKIIVELGMLNVDEYNLASDIGQVFVKAYTENMGSTSYDVEEYLHYGKTLKYYFKDNDIRLIKYDEQDIRIIRVEYEAKQELLAKPDGYTYAIQ